MSCSYYVFRQGDFYCTKKEDYVKSDVYYKYCRNYAYPDCPIYKENSSGGCYLTSACVQAKGLSDDCYELETLRCYRDMWLKSTVEGKEIVKQYYEIAPKIVCAINATNDSKSVYEMLYERMVKPYVEFIEKKEFHEAMELYRNMILELKEKYLLE